MKIFFFRMKTTFCWVCCPAAEKREEGEKEKHTRTHKHKEKQSAPEGAEGSLRDGAMGWWTEHRHQRIDSWGENTSRCV